MIAMNKDEDRAALEFLRGNEIAEESLLAIRQHLEAGEEGGMDGPRAWAGYICAILAVFYQCSPNFEIGDTILEFARDCAKERAGEEED